MINYSTVDLLTARYKRYVTEYSIPTEAISLELAVFLYNLCEEKSIQRIVEYGSGFSTWVFLLYKRSRENVSLHSYENDSYWMTVTHSAVTDVVLEPNTIVSPRYPDLGNIKPDLIFLDIKRPWEREPYLREIMETCKVRSISPIIVVDDMHYKEYRSEVKSLCEEYGCHYKAVRKETLDEYGRYSAVLEKNNENAII